jgi:hypothetical protein
MGHPPGCLTLLLEPRVADLSAIKLWPICIIGTHIARVWSALKYPSTLEGHLWATAKALLNPCARDHSGPKYPLVHSCFCPRLQSRLPGVPTQKRNHSYLCSGHQPMVSASVLPPKTEGSTWVSHPLSPPGRLAQGCPPPPPGSPYLLLGRHIGCWQPRGLSKTALMHPSDADNFRTIMQVVSFSLQLSC